MDDSLLQAPAEHSKSAITWIASGIALIVFATLAYKAATASMTHDESSTYLNLVHESTLNLWSCHRNPACWTTANNHLLNTLGMRWSSALFGPSPFALRLPNLLLLLAYLLSAVCFIRDTATSIAAAIFGSVLFVCNAFVLDFFALARGYGMGVGCMMVSMFYLWRFLRDKHSSTCIKALIAATLAVFANLTYLSFVVALCAGVAIYFIAPMIRRPRKMLSGVVPLSLAGCLILLFAYFYRPILILISLGEFEYGAPTLRESWTVFARDSLNGVFWFGERSPEIMALLTAIVLLVAVIVPWLSVRKEESVERRFSKLLSLVFILFMAFFIGNHLFTGANYPVGRKSIIYFPIAVMLIYLLVIRLSVLRRLWGQAVLLAVSVVMAYHVISAFNPKVYREWWYDATTREMLSYVEGTARDGAPATLAVEWIFHPSSDFYITTQDLNISLIPYTKDISKDFAVEYYYLHPDQAPALEPEFAHEKTFEGRWLMKRK